METKEVPLLRAEPGATISLPQPLRVFWLLNVLLCVLCLAIERGGKALVHWKYPYDFPFIPFQQFVDFYCFRPRFEHFHQLDFFSLTPDRGLRFMYPAPVALLYQGFYWNAAHPLRHFLVLTLSLLLVLGFFLWRVMVARGIRPVVAGLFLFSALLFSYPFWFEYLLGNMEVCIFLLVAFGVLAFLRGRTYTAAVLIGVAASMKIFPFVYLAIFLSQRRYRQLAVGIVSAGAVTLFSFWLVCPSLAISVRGVQTGLDKFRSFYMLRYWPTETGFDHSLFGFFKRVFHSHIRSPELASHLLTGYLALAALGGVALYFLWIRKLPLLNQITALTIASIVLPPTSHDYTLMHLYLPWGLLICYCLQVYRGGGDARELVPAFICFGLLLSPESELIRRGLGLSGQFKAVTLVALMWVALRNPWPMRFPQIEAAGRV